MDSLIFIEPRPLIFTALLSLRFLFSENKPEMANVYFESAVFILIFISLGKYLEASHKGENRRSD